MNRFLTRLSLFIKLWFRSYYGMTLMLLIPIVAVTIYSQSTYTVESLASIVFEEAAPIWFILILQWCLSVDIDSKFHMQVITYPVARWKFLIERFLFAAVIFMSLLGIVTLALIPFMGNFAWQSILFTLPIYITFVGFAVAGTVIGNHSVGGLFAGMLFWMAFEFGGIFLGDLNVILLKYGSVYTFVKGEAGFFAGYNHWIFYNRLFYLGMGVLLMGLAIFQFNRKTA